jgi:ATP-dependent protease HslVU (ClpYQ) ATPase subunit
MTEEKKAQIAEAQAKAAESLTPEQKTQVETAQEKKAELAASRKLQAKIAKGQLKEAKTMAAKKTTAKPATKKTAKPAEPKGERTPTVFLVTKSGEKYLSSDDLKGHRVQVAKVLLKRKQATNQEIADEIMASGGFTRKTKAPPVGVVGSQMFFLKKNGYVEVVRAN